MISIARSGHISVNIHSPQCYNPILCEHEGIHDRAQATAEANGIQTDRWSNLAREGIHLAPRKCIQK